MAAPSMNVGQLLKTLKNQGFTVKETSDGYVVIGPEGTSASFHASMVGNPANRTWENTWAELRKLGVKTKQELTEETSRRKRAAQAAAKAAGPYPCPECDFEATTPGGLGAHRNKAHGFVSARAKWHSGTVANGKVRGGRVRISHMEPADKRVKAKRLLENAERQMEQLAATHRELTELFNEVYEENTERGARLKKMEGALDKALEAL